LFRKELKPAERKPGAGQAHDPTDSMILSA
jgi:hypothetical protein